MQNEQSEIIWSDIGAVFALMGVATIYSCITSRNDLPLVTLALPEAMEEGSYRVPNQAVQQQGYRHLFVVEEQDGAWGKEYVCREILLPNMSVQGKPHWSMLTWENFRWWSAAPSHCMMGLWFACPERRENRMNEKRLWRLFCFLL